MTYCNSISVAEHVVMSILNLVRNFVPADRIVLDGGTLAGTGAHSYSTNS